MPVSPHTHEPDESWFDLEEHLNWPHNHRLNDLIGMSQQEKQSLHRRDHTEAVTHEYPTKKVKGTDLDDTMTLVGESGGLSSIYEAEPSNIAFGMLNITTEHGPLFLDPDSEYLVLDVYQQGDLSDELRLLDRLTDSEADNLRVAIRQGDLPEDMTLTWAVVQDSWQQMPADIQAHYGDPEAITEALARVIARVGASTLVLATYDEENGE